jgi:SPOR domain
MNPATNEGDMSGSGSRVTEEINLDEFERRLRAAGAQAARAEDPLAELSRLVEFSHMGISNGEAGPRRAEPAIGPAKPSTSIENAALRPTLEEEVEEISPGASEADREARQDYEFDNYSSDGAASKEPPEDRPSRRWKLAVSALALAGVAMIGAVFALRGGAPGFSKDAPFIAAAQGPTKVAPPSDQTVASATDAGASLLKDGAKPGPVKVVNSEEQPVDLNAQPAINNPPPAANPPGSPDQAKAPVSATDASAIAATMNTPLVAPTVAEPPHGMSSEFPDPKPVRTVSLRPDGTPIAPVSPPDQAASDAKPPAPPTDSASKPAEAPTKPAPKTASDATGVAQPSTPKIDLPTKLSPKSSARAAVGKTDTTAPVATAQTPTNELTQNGASAKPEKTATAKKPKPGQVADATETTGAIATPVDATAATASGGWSVQLAAPKSEAEAKSKLTQLTSKYSSELNGSPIGVHKATVNGETIYRLRVSGLTKADAAALCARLKGDGGECFIAK